jgi:hypothetical protein
MNDHLMFWKVCAQWVPRKLKGQEKMNQIQHFLWYADDREDMLNRIVTGDDSWVYHYQP